MVIRMTTKLRGLLKGDEIVVVPGAYDGVTAKVIEKAGFPAVYITGYGLEASLLGSPDVGLLSFGEIADRVGKIAAAVNVPTIVNGEAGFGGPLQVIRAVKEMERAGIAGMHIEDQVQPKKCGTMATKKVVPVSEAVAKLKAALDARTDSDFFIIARTDSDIISIEEVIERCNIYLEVGADMVYPVTSGFIKGRTASELAEIYRRFAKEVRGPLLAARMDAAEMTVQDAQAAGFKLLIVPMAILSAATQAAIEVVNELKTQGITNGYFKRNPGFGTNFNAYSDWIGLQEILDVEKKYEG